MIKCGVTDFVVRLQAIATPLVQNMESVEIIPPPKGVDGRVLTWKGASVLGRMDGVTDMWVTGADWVSGKAGSSLRRSRSFASSRALSECGR